MYKKMNGCSCREGRGRKRTLCIYILSFGVRILDLIISFQIYFREFIIVFFFGNIFARFSLFNYISQIVYSLPWLSIELKKKKIWFQIEIC